MLSDERYKQLMEAVGMPNSRSLLAALYQCATEATLIERAAWIKKEQLLQEKINSLQEQLQIAYEKYEFCRSINCPEIADKTHCDVFLHDCLFTAKRFHQWLQCHNFKIIRENANEHRTIK